ncbi:hypothetical protein C0J52_25360 [Blattella germanica]|nr:hypothetical protein C0J52_25360 [Blattella germanica]
MGVLRWRERASSDHAPVPPPATGECKKLQETQVPSIVEWLACLLSTVRVLTSSEEVKLMVDSIPVGLRNPLR